MWKREDSVFLQGGNTDLWRKTSSSLTWCIWVASHVLPFYPVGNCCILTVSWFVGGNWHVTNKKEKKKGRSKGFSGKGLAVFSLAIDNVILNSSRHISYSFWTELKKKTKKTFFMVLHCWQIKSTWFAWITASLHLPPCWDLFKQERTHVTLTQEKKLCLSEV